MKGMDSRDASRGGKFGSAGPNAKGIISFRQPYGGIDHVDQWRELSGNDDTNSELRTTRPKESGEDRVEK
jgi:hypothetical protein